MGTSRGHSIGIYLAIKVVNPLDYPEKNYSWLMGIVEVEGIPGSWESTGSGMWTEMI